MNLTWEKIAGIVSLKRWRMGGTTVEKPQMREVTVRKVSLVKAQRNTVPEVATRGVAQPMSREEIQARQDAVSKTRRFAEPEPDPSTAALPDEISIPDVPPTRAK